ncbi:phosphatidylinositol N-acetylglucosaminyltransferase subunit H isoform X1 [Pieris rapae]|uniref:phosphatidylinositol N-acetylglucosaminyltransferase subunit H isoform X1 n=1 Tax=Pieris rapae TaxID=64459 RepID=UPI001E27A3EE|nr:phosphatidylinositol N-acetylglucosaminyltransferase subunit H isoform X1 [Pieris rapae]
MTINKQIINSENVNGFNITLKVEKRNNYPTSQRYVISYKNKEQKSSLWSKKSLICAIIFNILAMSYIRISFTATSIIIIVMSFLIFFWVTHTVQSETLLVIPTVGIQTSVKYVVGREDNYVSWDNIDDVIINEVIKFNRVLYFLTILVKSSNQAEQIKLMPLFKYTKPRLMMLEVIYSEIQSLLLDSRKETNEFRDGQGSGDK